jgi:hypothetical protein
MANTFTAGITGIISAASKTGLAIWNTDATAIVRVYRIWVMNNQTAVVSGTNTTKLEVHRITACSGGRSTQNIITKHNTGDTLNANVNAYFDGPTVTKTDLFRTLWYCSDEKQSNTTPTIDELMGVYPFCLAYELGYNETNLEPITCRQNQGVSISWGSTTPAGTLDFFMEFTIV